MRKFIKALMIIGLILQTAAIKAQDFTITKFEVAATHLDGDGKIKVNASGATLVTYSVTIVRQYVPGTSEWKPLNAEIGLSTPNSSNTPFFLSKTNKITNTVFPDANSTLGVFTFTDTVKSTSQLTLGIPIILGFRNVGASAIKSYDFKKYHFAIQSGGTTPGGGGYWVEGTPPPYIAPVTGAVPLYEYRVIGAGTKWFLSRTYYSNSPGYAYFGIFGYVFPTEQPNTVPLYRFYIPSIVGSGPADSDNYGLSATAIPTGYLLDGIIGYVYAAQVAKTMPVYEHRYSNVFRYSNEPDSYGGWINYDVKFYILQHPQNSLNPLPDDEWEEFYTYFNAPNGDHFYTSKRTSRDPWMYENVMAYISRVPRPGMVALYRYFYRSVVDHYYTTVKQDYGDYKYEGIAGYVYPSSGTAGTVAIHGWMHEQWNHYYRASYISLASGYSYEGIQFYMKQYPY